MEHARRVAKNDVGAPADDHHVARLSQVAHDFASGIDEDLVVDPLHPR